MTMSYDDWAYDQHLADIGREEELEKRIEEIAVDNASWYLGTFGDAVENRVRGLMNEATLLLESGHIGASLVLNASSLELLVRHFVLKPLVSGAFLTDVWAELLVDKLVVGQSGRDRQLLPMIANEWGIDLKTITLSDRKSAWDVFVSDLVPLRNQFVHKGASVSLESATRAAECTAALFNGLLPAIAKKLRLSWPESGAWHKVVKGVGSGTRFTDYDPRDPFGS
jgi:hypothetical protein